MEGQPYDAPKLPWHGGTPVKESVVREFVHEVFAVRVHLGIRYEWELDQCEYTEEEKQIPRENTRLYWEKRVNLKANGKRGEESEASKSEDMDDDENFDRGYQCLALRPMISMGITDGKISGIQQSRHHSGLTAGAQLMVHLGSALALVLAAELSYSGPGWNARPTPT